MSRIEPASAILDPGGVYNDVPEAPPLGVVGEKTNVYSQIRTKSLALRPGLTQSIELALVISNYSHNFWLGWASLTLLDDSSKWKQLVFFPKTPV